jgi:anti-sigma regulatory factor (Ser/Thr protein kinase)
MKPLRKPVQLKILSVPSHLPIVRAALEKMCELIGFESEVAGNVVLSVDEALTNVIRHAYEGKEDQPIDIVLTPLCGQEPDGLRIELRDYGRHVDPGRIRSRDLADVRPGGLGVHIMTECMDSVSFSPGEGGGTQLTMVKRCKQCASKQETMK